MKTFLLGLLVASALVAGTYDGYSFHKDNNDSKAKLDMFMDGDFKEIVRFDMIFFSGTEVSSDENDDRNVTRYYFDPRDYNPILQAVRAYQEKNENILIKIIGHTNESGEDGEKLSQDYAKSIQEAFIADKIDEKITVVESRGDRDMAYSDDTSSSSELSNRVMVTIYVLKTKG
ncbi:MAG: OmpA family protein [Campylobacterota bacterium]|nr:OmpA family protein [Campylobacterota bacterium]